jgi:hypothetical protein
LGYVPEIAGGIAVDSSGDAYVTSATTQSDFPTTRGAYQTTSNIYTKHGVPNGSDVFVTKLNATGSALIYSTYLGSVTKSSTAYSGGSGIAVDAHGDAYVTGWTNSTTFPTKNPIQSTNHGGMDSFVTELNPSGSGLLFSTYLGGNSDDLGWGIALDTANNIYVGGGTGSGNFPTTAGAYDTTSGSGFAAKISGLNAAAPLIASSSLSSTSGRVTDTGAARNTSGGAVPSTPSNVQNVLPADHIFTAADQGGYTFTSKFILRSRGKQTLTATDTQNSSLTAIDSINVT